MESPEDLNERRRNLDQRIQALSAQLRQSDSFTETISRWVNAPVTYISLRHEQCAVIPEHAALLKIPRGSQVLSRHGYLEAGPPGARRQVADVRAVVVADRLSVPARRSLESRKIPLGVILAGEWMRRHTHGVTRVHSFDANGQQILRVAAVVTVGGVPVAAVDEIVYRHLFEAELPQLSI